jgi:LuxR family maltose regulon positive regulatory protein
MYAARLARARVNERLERAARFPVTLIVAPAGFGKTVALRDFLEQHHPNAVRYDVRREDGTLLEFVRRLSESLEPVAPSALAAFPAMQERVLATDEPVRQLSDWFAEHLKDVACTIAIDDLHYAATDPASIALFADLIERTSEHINWIIAARSDVGLPVGTWIAYGRMDIPLGEDDLRFTTQEALAAAEQNTSDIDAQEVEALRHLTEGWPVALTIALRTRTHAADLRTASSGTREMVYRYLVEQVFTGLTLPQRAFALATSVFSSFDSGIAEALGANAEFLHDFRARVAFLSEVSPGEYRYHDLFRDFLETELRRAGEREWVRALGEGAELLERREEYQAALVLYTKADAGNDILRILERCGFSLFEEGASEALASALSAVSEQQRQSNATALGLRAMLDANLGRFEIAERGFLTAIDLAKNDDDVRLRLVHRYAIELVRSDRDPIAFLEPHARDSGIDPRYRVPLLGTLATAYVHAGRSSDALTAIASAMSLLNQSISDEVRARLYQQASYVERYAGSKEKARTYATSAVELALENNLFELAARAYSVLYTIVRDTTDDPLESLNVLTNLSECARKGASSQAALFALVASYDVEVERGDDRMLEDLDRQMHETQTSLPRLRTTGVLPVVAMRQAWNGEFAPAFETLRGTSAEQTTNEQRALRASETALYAMAAGLHEDGEQELQIAVTALDAISASAKDAIRSRLLLALAELVRGHDTAAHRHLTDAEHAIGASMPRLRTLAQAVRTIYRLQLGQCDSTAFEAALDRLRAQQFAGYARLLAALPATERQGGYASLTPAEREILHLLAKGASTKEVANKTKRSPHTVDTHIRSICRKLSCSGRREAVALATSQGWVEA